MNSKTLIIGGGFAGQRACRALRGAPTDITLFDPRSAAVMLPALPDVAGDWLREDLLIRPLKDLLPSSVEHIRRAVDSIDLDAGTVSAGGESFLFDWLLITCGAVTDFHGFDQHLDAVHRLDSLESAQRIRDAFRDYLRQNDTPQVVISGGGYTGLELAAALHFRARADGVPCEITVIDPSETLLPFLPAARRNRILNFLRESGITLQTGQTVTAFDGRTVTAGDHRFENAFFCWAAGSTCPVSELRGHVERLRDGRLKTAADLSLPGYPRVFAAGDAAAFNAGDGVLRKAVNFAWYGGSHAGKSIARRLRGRPTRPFRPIDAGWVIPLHNDSVGQLFSRIWIRGRFGLRLHYFMCGFRNYRISNFLGFLKTAVTLFNKGGRS